MPSYIPSLSTVSAVKDSRMRSARVLLLPEEAETKDWY